MGLLRRHAKHEHLNKWSPWHRCIRANITNPEEMSLFAELKTLTENVHPERCHGDFRKAADWRRTVQRKEEAAQEKRSFIERRAKNHQRAGDTDADLMDLVAQVHL